MSLYWLGHYRNVAEGFPNEDYPGEVFNCDRVDMMQRDTGKHLHSITDIGVAFHELIPHAKSPSSRPQ